jgi:TonB family protein
MKSILKSIIITSLFVFSQQTVFAQDADKTVAITVSGSGKTQEDAKQSALRSAIEQAFGAFISTKTEVLNDQLIADQITSVSSGSIKTYNLLNESQLPNGTWGVTLKVIVSLNKLTSFVEAKGISVEIKGGLFALNIKQQMLNEEGEIKAVEELVSLLHQPMQISFDYAITSGNPKSIDSENKNWEIPIVVTATSNKNIDFCANYFMKTLAAISLTTPEVESYKELNKKVFHIIVYHKGITSSFYLRKQNSIKSINNFAARWEFYVNNFAVQSVIGETYGKNNDGNFHDFVLSNEYNEEEKIKINFPSLGKISATFKWNDKLTLSQIEQMTGYTIKPRGLVSSSKTICDNQNVYLDAEEMPEFQGGPAEMMRFISKNTQYPQEAREAGIGGKCFISFIVGCDGIIRDVKISKGVPGCSTCNIEAVRVVKNFPTFKPGKIKGIEVAVRITIPFNFSQR